ncbi:MAG: DegV family protein, partial [Oscillospiraceae bacterium]|nr:DegV family protein [Oscillospiraceae bacterium]
LHVDDEGRLISREKARGMKAALGVLVDKVKELGIGPLDKQTVFICHADCPDSVAYVEKLLAERYGITDVRSDYIGPVIGAHTGAGTLGIFFEGSAR